MTALYDLFTPSEVSLLKMCLVHAGDNTTQEQLKKDCQHLLDKLRGLK